MKDQNAVRANEQIKLGAQTLMAIGVALGGWAIVKLYDSDTYLRIELGWLILGILIAGGSLKALEMLQAEE